MAKNEKAVASVLAFEKKLVPSDGYFYGTNWDKRAEQTALKLIEKSVRGTVSHRLKSATDKDLLKLNMDIAHANPQTVDACALGEHQDTLKVGFTYIISSALSFSRTTVITTFSFVVTVDHLSLLTLTPIFCVGSFN